MKNILTLLTFHIAAFEIADATPSATSDITIHQLPDRRIIIERVHEINLPDPPQPRDIHPRVSRLSPAEAAAWHQHAIEQKGETRP